MRWKIGVLVLGVLLLIIITLAGIASAQEINLAASANGGVAREIAPVRGSPSGAVAYTNDENTATYWSRSSYVEDLRNPVTARAEFTIEISLGSTVERLGEVSYTIGWNNAAPGVGGDAVITRTANCLVKQNGVWTEIGCSPSTTFAIYGNWANVTDVKIRLYSETYARTGTTPSGAWAGATLYELEAWGESCTLLTCADYPGQCGPALDDGCGGTLDCSNNCASEESCESGVCVPTQTTNYCSSDNDIIMKLYSATNSHGALWNDGSYNYEICCQDIFEAGNPACSPATPHPTTCANPVLWLEDIYNAHAENPNINNYQYPVCYGELTCHAENTGPIDSCIDTSEKIVVRLDYTNNSHIANKDFTDYPIKICCKPEVATLGDLYWSNMMNTPINTADLGDSVKLIANLPEEEGKDITFEIRQKEDLFGIDLLWPDSKIDTITAIGSTKWIADTADIFYFKVDVDRDGTFEYNSKGEVFGELTVSSTEDNSPPEAIIDYPKFSSPRSERRFRNATEQVDFNITLIDKDNDLSVDWNFGDGNITKFTSCLTSNICNTTHIYYKTGTREVYVTARELDRDNPLEAHNYTRVFIYGEDIVLFPIISSPEPDWIFGETVRSVEFNGSESYVANCTEEVGIDCAQHTAPLGLPAPDCYAVQDLICFEYPKTGSFGIGTAPGNYDLWYDWIFSEGIGKLGSWNSNYGAHDSYDGYVEFKRWFFTADRHWASLRLGFEVIG